MNPFFTKALAIISAILPFVDFVSNQETPTPQRKTPDRKKLTHEEIMAVCDMYYRFENIHTQEELAKMINTAIGHDKTRTTYARIYRQHRQEYLAKSQCWTNILRETK